MARVRKVRITRPPGRRTRIEQRITASLLETANFMRTWLIDNNRVATGRAAGSLNVVITRQPKLSTGASKAFTTAAAAAIKFKDDKTAALLSKDLTQARTVLNALDIGLVSGQIKAAPHFSFAMQGRPAGQPPPIEAIIKWMIAKKVKPKFESLRGSAFLIARRIGEVGTQPPHFSDNLTTTIVRASTNRMLNLIKRPLAKVVGRRFVRFLLAASKDFDNMEITSNTVTLFNEALDDL